MKIFFVIVTAPQMNATVNQKKNQGVEHFDQVNAEWQDTGNGWIVKCKQGYMLDRESWPLKCISGLVEGDILTVKRSNKNVYKNNKKIINVGEVVSVTTDAQKRIYGIGTDKRVYVFDQAKNTWHPYMSPAVIHIWFHDNILFAKGTDGTTFRRNEAHDGKTYDKWSPVEDANYVVP